MPYNAAAQLLPDVEILTLDDLETEGNLVEHALPNFDVGDSPSSTAVNSEDNIAYAANADSDTVSVINPSTHKVSNVAVGDYPWDITLDEMDNLAYMANYGSDSVSIINGTSQKVSNVTVGDGLNAIATDSSFDLVYVVNSDSVSMISGTNKQVQAGVSFDVNPFYAGRIECNDITVPINQYFYVNFRTQCTAQANEGFQFSSCCENLGSNSSRTISASLGDWFTNNLNALRMEPSPATLNVTRFGNFTANFERLPLRFHQNI
ncbi:MAG TPA: YncE family protein [Nitrososphaeraceae archaeon]|nr:YncE family protein [Nitrososphaeraceae archaeon]